MAEIALHRTNEEFELRVNERTLELRDANAQLQRELAERRQAEAELEHFFTLSLDMICIASTNGYFKRLNPAFERTLGYTTDDLLAKPFVESCIPRMCRALWLRWRSWRRASRPFGSRTAIAARMARTSGWLGSRQPAPDGAIYAIARDMTERKRADEKFQRLLKSAPDAIVIVNSTGQMVMVDAQTELLFGYQRAQSVGQPVEVLLPARFRGRHGQRRRTFCGSAVRTMGIGSELYGLRQDGAEFRDQGG